MKHEKLKVEKRKVLGKDVKKLRRDGVLPANVYGKDIKSTAVQLPTSEFSNVYAQTGETGLVDLDLEGTTIPVLIQNVYKNFRGEYLHADFFKVNLKEKVKANIPLEIIGEPKAVTEKVGILMNILSEIEVEALPSDLPEKVEVNVEHLTNIDDQIIVSDLKVNQEVTVLTDPNQVVSKIAELVTKEAAEQAAEEAAAAEAASTETAEGETPTEGQAPEGQAEGQEAPSEEKPAEGQ
ncbi:MAG: 50S ribosomal protein L25 [Patescibacteria group bacterium]